MQQSNDTYRRATEVMPGGVGGDGQFRAPYPLYLSRAAGARIRDLEGREYLDYMLGAGAILLGHGHPAIQRAVRKAVESALPNLAATEHQVELAERLRRYVPSMERIRFAPSGTEANQAAIRLARAFTGRAKIGKFEGGYHGGADNVLVSVSAHEPSRGPRNRPNRVPYHNRIPPDLLAQTVVLPFNDIEASVSLIEEYAAELALVIVEPVLGFGGGIPADQAFLQALREVTTKHGIVLAFDEVITGFRFRTGGAQDYYDVRPDLTVLGKVIAGGYPLAAFGGRADVMELLSPASHPADHVFQSGTFTGFPASIAAGLACLDVIEDSDVFSKLNRLGERMRGGLRAIAKALDMDIQVTGLGPIFHLHFTRHPVTDARVACDADQEMLAKLHRSLLERGIHMYHGHLNFISFAHTERDVDSTLSAIRDMLKEASQGGPKWATE